MPAKKSKWPNSESKGRLVKTLAMKEAMEVMAMGMEDAMGMEAVMAMEEVMGGGDGWRR